MTDGGCKMQDARCKMLDARCKIQDARCKMQDGRYWIATDATFSVFIKSYILSD